MKKFVAAAIILAAAVNSQAAAQRFPISVTGTIESDTGMTKITDQNWVTAPGNRLVMYVDMDAHVVGIEEWTADLTTQVDRDPVLSGTQGLVENYRMAQIGNKKFTADLGMVAMDWDRDGIDDHDGTLQIAVKLTTDKVTGNVKSMTGTITGVLNDPVNSGNDGANMLFNGKVKTTGPAF